jgi:hypothetical protein
MFVLVGCTVCVGDEPYFDYHRDSQPKPSQFFFRAPNTRDFRRDFEIEMGVRKMDYLDNQNTCEVLDKLVRFVCSVRSDLFLRNRNNSAHDFTKILTAKCCHVEQY